MAQTLATTACILATLALTGAAWAGTTSFHDNPALSLGEPEEEPPVAPTTYTASGDYLVAAVVPGLLGDDAGMAAAGGASSLAVPVAAGTAAVLVELRWSSEAQGMALHVQDGTGAWAKTAAADAAGPAYHRVVIDSPVEGEWSALAFAETVVVNVQFTLAFTVFADGPVPDDFTGLPA